MAASKKQTKAQGNRVVGILMIVVGGVVAILWALPILFEAYSSGNWEAVEGTITHSEVSEKRSRAKHGRTRYDYSVDVKYRFIVNETEYAGETLRIGKGWTRDRQSQAKIVAAYPAGRRITVYYDQSDPQRNVLEPGASLESWAPLLISLVVVAVGVFLWVIGKRNA